MPIITDEDLIAELRAALAWALDQIEDDLDPDPKPVRPCPLDTSTLADAPF